MQTKLHNLVEEARSKGERRNSYLNLAYTAPHANTGLQTNISYARVASLAVDMFMDTSLPPGEPPTSTAQAASVDGETVKAERPGLESIEALPKFPWRVPTLVEKGYEIPICVTENYELEVGNFPRLGMDVVVNAAWLALEWAKKEKHEEAVSV